MIRIEVSKNTNETNGSLLRRFSKKMQGSGILREVKRGRYFARPASTYTKKKSALHRLKKRAEMEKQKKLGKIRDVYGKKTR